MPCSNEDVYTRLPLYVAGTLSAEEHGRVETHIATCPSCQAELAMLREVSEAVQAYGDDLLSEHIPSEQLVAYSRSARVPADAQERLERHLKTCDWCARELEILQEVDNELAQPRAASPAARATAGWVAFFRNIWPSFSATGLRPALAAAMILVIVALLYALYLPQKNKDRAHTARSTGKTEPSKTPEKDATPLAQLTVPRFVLERDTAVRRDDRSAPATRITLPPSLAAFSLSFFLPITNDPGVRYDLSVLDAQNRTLLERPDIKSKDAFGNFEETFERKLFDRGRYLIKVTEVKRPDGPVLKDYRFPLDILP